MSATTTSPRHFVPWVRRTELACYHCRRRRVKCRIPQERPRDPCERCTNRNLCCQYISVADQEGMPAPAKATPSPTTPPAIALPPLNPGSAPLPVAPKGSAKSRKQKQDSDASGEEVERNSATTRTCGQRSPRATRARKSGSISISRIESATSRTPWPWASEHPPHIEHQSVVPPPSEPHSYVPSTHLDYYSVFCLDHATAPTAVFNVGPQSECFADSLPPENTYGDPWMHTDVWETLGIGAPPQAPKIATDHYHI
ncbi:hypothetical protein R3P38DRAFT_2961616 [Favolaschia claudopus]|uniref:Zn(2)-C6 fungal-type domain-containing protein n=1 Tax=Favolaschia claudopus TaxID=2862362 RepID=A0AAW0BAU3_9AGAR